MQFLHLSTREPLDSAPIAPIAPIAQSATPKTADRLGPKLNQAIGSQHRQNP
ncbi:hypothetical protein H6G51_05645 [Limnothrix sp. FACHB-708]|nr:hypothetical protein [Limnothrix sp. FACHB-406]MBD2552755.1 hypothetical protein [Limnothrix sp. FACHB-708]MBD2590025.1 hypothetical protein [Limnothrix sp. FACHB-406]